MIKTSIANKSQVKLKVKKGDNVVVIAGKDRGKTGKVLHVVSEQNKALVEGINIVTKHQKPKSTKEKGGIIKKSAPIQISNIMVICPTCGKATRVAKSEISGKNLRICKKCGASLDKEFMKSKKKETKKKDESEIKQDKEKKSNKKSELAEKTTDLNEAEKSVNKEIQEKKKSEKPIETKSQSNQKKIEKTSTTPTHVTKQSLESKNVNKQIQSKVTKSSTVRRTTNRGK